MAMQIGSATEAFSNRVIFAQNVSMPIIAYLTCHSRYVQQMLHGNRTKKRRDLRCHSCVVIVNID